MLSEWLQSTIHERKCQVIGIDGMGGAGKTTVSEEISEMLHAQEIPVTILHIDDFIHPRCVRYRDDVPEWECYYQLQWWYAPLLELLAAYRRDGAFSGTVQLYNKEQDCYGEQEITIPENAVIIVEGVFLQRPELKGTFDAVVYLDVPEHVRLERVLSRDGYIGDEDAIRAKYENRYFPAERHYAESCKPADGADFMVEMHHK